MTDEREKEQNDRWIADQIKSGHITPAQKSLVECIVYSMSEKRIVKYTQGEKTEDIDVKEAVKKFIENIKPQVSMKELSETGEPMSKAETLHDFAMIYVEKEKMEYRKALSRAAKDHPDMVKAKKGMD